MENLTHPTNLHIKTMLQSKMNELDNMKDPIIDAVIDIHIFESILIKLKRKKYFFNT